MKVVNNYRSKGKDFWLTMAPEWGYIIPYSYGCGQWGSHSYQNDFYTKLTRNIGVSNFNYIWPQAYNQGSANGVCNPTKDKITPTAGMDQFVSSLAWAATTEAGHAINNQGIAAENQMPLIPASKFAIGIPAAIGAAGEIKLYYLSPDLIKSSWALMSSYGVYPAGFMNWAADWDATPHSVSSLNYTHSAWETGRAVNQVLSK